MTGEARRIILYELNEVPWSIVDRYLARRPDSRLARLIAAGRSETTINRDPEHLHPWGTWPTFHKGVYTEQHRSVALGQDPATFRHPSVWDIAEEAGLSIGLFGPLQSWPPRAPRHGGFYVPDTFARSPETYPEGLQRFQSFNLAMTRDNAFSATAPINARRAALTGLDLLARGLSPWAAARLARQLVRERRDRRWKAARPMAQALPAFDLYWRLHRKHRPHLSIFFTNHVAGMMHRYWGDAVPEYSQQFDYEVDDVYGSFVFEGMDIADRQLDRIAVWMAKHPDTTLMIASSMGQDSIPYKHLSDCFVVKEPAVLAAGLQLGDVEPGLAMYPKVSIALPDPERARAAAAVLGSLRVGTEELFDSVLADGRTVSFAVHAEPHAGSRVVTQHGDHEYTLADLGIVVEERLGGGNTAYHIPEGILITVGPDVPADGSRADVEVIEIAPRILADLGVSRRPSVAVTG